MLRKLLILVTWFPIAISALIINLTILSILRSEQKSPLLTERPPVMDLLYIGSSGTAQVLGAEIERGDARPLILKHYFATHNSPFYPYAENFISEADKYQLDFRLVPAIGMCESNLGKRIPSKDSFNAWGISVYTGQLSGAKFRDWPSAIAWVSKFIKEKFYDRGITDLKDIGAIWAPPSVANGYSWTNCVTSFMDEIK